MKKALTWLKNMNTAAQAILGLVAFAGILVAGVGVFTYKQVYALDTEIRLVGLRVDQKITQDKRDWIQRRVWDLTDRHSKPCLEIPECRELLLDLEKSDDELEKIYQDQKDLGGAT